jgi:PTS system cellobiose-specific IIC component
MNKIVEFFDEKLSPIASKISAQRHLIAIRDGLILTMPLMIVGSIIIIFSSDFPIPAWGTFITGVFPTWDDFIWGVIFQSTMSLAALIAVMGIAYSLAKSYKEEGIVASVLAVSAFFLLQSAPEWAWSSSVLGAEGLFLAIITALVVAEIYVKVVKSGLVIKLPDSVPVAISRSFVALVPGAIIIVLFALIHVGFAMTSYGTAGNFIVTILQTPLVAVSASYLGAMVTSFFISIFWCFGLHGDLIVNAVAGPLQTAGLLANIEAFRASGDIVNIAVEGFQSLFLNVGGTGGTLGLAIVCAFFSKSKQLKLVGRLSLGPGIFNINEPIVFGLPIVMNPILIIPYLFSPLIVATITYFAMSLGLVHKIVAAVPWTTPVFFAGFLSTGGDWKAVVLQAVNFLIVIVIYYPFIKMWDNKQYALEQSSAE